MKAEALIAFAQHLIRTESLSGREGDVAELVQQQMHALGYDEVLTDAYGSVIGVIRGQGEKTILFDAHMDTVPVPNPDEWHYPPFDAEIDADRIYGRGSADMKGALAAMVMAAGALIQEKHRLAGNIVVTATTWEEFFEGYTLGKVIDLLKTRSLYPAAVVIGEATHLAIARGQRGRGEVVLKTYGKPAHASHPQLGIHAVEKILPLLQHILSLHPPQDPFLGEGILVLTDIISYPYPGASVIPQECRVTFDRRLLVGETEESILTPLRQIIKDQQQQDSQLQAEVSLAEGILTRPDGKQEQVKKFARAWVIEETHPLVQAAKRGISTLGLPPVVSKYSFCTNGSYSAGVAGIPTIGFGPSCEGMAHTMDEYIARAQLEMACQGYQAIAKAFLLT